VREHDWHGAARPLQGRHSRARRGQNNIWGKRDQLRANLRSRSALPPAQRISIRTFSPLVQPNFCRPCRKAAMRACPTGSSALVLMSTPNLRMRSGCCAPATSGIAAAPPISVINSRRLIVAPMVRPRYGIGCDGVGRAHVRFGSWLCKNATSHKRSRINVRQNHLSVRKDSQTCLILVGLRNIILEAFQFFAFSHSQGQKRTFRSAIAMSALPPESDIKCARSP
jgi:hypothetical protein